MKSLRFIQIGDIHYPQAMHDLDHKDKALSDRFAKRIATNPLRPVLQEVSRLCEGVADHHQKITGLLFCGDITSFGEITPYEKCLEWLTRLLQLGNRARWPLKRLHSVVGNHDVVRNNCSPFCSRSYRKFQPFIDAWNKIDCKILVANRARSVGISLKNCKVRVFSLNSCVGCGEFRGLPPSVQKQLLEELKSVADSDTSNEMLQSKLSMAWEQLDSPAFDGVHIENVTERIERLDLKTMPLILAHHNLLPQATTRVDLYTEVINSGVLRQRLASCRHPVLFCHGHIHEELCEVITDPMNNCGPLVTMAATELRKGFNLIEIQYGSMGVPLGIVIEPYRFQHGKKNASEPFRVPLYNMSRYHEVGHNLLPKILSNLLKIEDTFQRFNTVYKVGSDNMGNRRPSQASFAEILREAEWLGYLKIINRAEEILHWQIKMLLPSNIERVLP